MAPEMIRHEMYDQKADVYSWGVLLVEVLRQQPPYEDQYLGPVDVRLTPGMPVRCWQILPSRCIFAGHWVASWRHRLSCHRCADLSGSVLAWKSRGCTG